MCSVYTLTIAHAAPIVFQDLGDCGERNKMLLNKCAFSALFVLGRKLNINERFVRTLHISRNYEYDAAIGVLLLPGKMFLSLSLSQ